MGYSLTPIEEDNKGYTLTPIEEEVQKGEPTSSFGDMMSELSQSLGLTEDAHANSARAANALAYSKNFGISPSIAYDYQDEISEHVRNNGGDVPFRAPKHAKGPVLERVVSGLSKGATSSNIGMVITQHVGESPEKMDMVESLSGLVGQMADLPIYIAGGVLGGGTANPIGAAGGAFGLEQGIRQMLVDRYQKGEVKDFHDLVTRLYDAAKETVKGEIVGASIPIAGGAASTVAGKLASESLMMTTASSVLNGEVPTAEDFIMNTLMVGIAHGTFNVAGRVGKGLADIYAKYGVHPDEAAGKIIDSLPEEKAKNPTEEDIVSATENYKLDLEEKTSLRPAVVRDGEIIVGDRNQTHSDIMRDSNIEPDAEHKRGFVTPDDRLLTRDEAKEWVKNNDEGTYKAWAKTRGEDAELHTQDYMVAKGLEPEKIVQEEMAKTEGEPEETAKDQEAGGNAQKTASGEGIAPKEAKTEEQTGIKNAVTLEERASEGKDEVEVEARRSLGAAFEKGKQLVDSGEINPRKLAEDLSNNPRALNAEESGALIYDRMRLRNSHAKAMDAIQKAQKSGNKMDEAAAKDNLKDIEEAINTNDEAARRTGYEQGLGLAARKMMIQEDYSLTNILQRARVASKDGKVPPELRAKLEDLSKQLEEANRKIDSYLESDAKKSAESVIEKIKNEERRAQKKAGRAQKKEELDLEWKDLVGELNNALSGLHANPMFDPEAIAVLGKMARNRVRAGVNAIGGIVDSIHEELTALGHDVNKRDIRDAISGYGKTVEMSKDEIDAALREARRQGRLISALEDAQSGKSPLRSGLQRDAATPDVRELERQVHEAMKEAGIDSAAQRTPEQQWRTALDAIKTRLVNSITDISKQLITGEKTPQKKGVAYDKEAAELKEWRDYLKDIKEQIEGKPGMSPEQRVKVAASAVEKSIAEYERRIKENDLTPGKKENKTPETEELKALRAKRDTLSQILKQMKDDAKPKRSPEEIALQAYKTRVAKQIADYKNRLETGDFSKTPRKSLDLDTEGRNLKAESERLKDRINEEIKRKEFENQTPADRAAYYFIKWRRAVILSSVTTVAKLTSAAAQRMVVTPVEEIVNGVISKVPGISEIAKKSPRYAEGLNIKAEVKAFSQMVDKATFSDMKEKLRTGKGQLDYLYGKKAHLPPEALDAFGHIHGALKVIPTRAEFFRSLEKRTEWALKNDLDLDNPTVQESLCSGAYVDANRAIFMNDNVVTNGYRMLLHYFELKGFTGKAMAVATQALMPIVKVPTNYVSETFNYAFGMEKGVLQVIYTLTKKDALKNLTNEQADNIMRSLTKGSIGTALVLIGYYMPDTFGGYYKPGEKRDPGDLQAGDVKIFGVSIPHYLLHSPPIEVLQMGATLRRVQDYYDSRMKEGGTGAGLWAAGWGAAQKAPFIDEPARIVQAARSGESASKFGAEFLSSLVIPPDVGKIAKGMDDADLIRKPKSVSDVFKLQIPGLRQDVPVTGIKGFTIRSDR